MSRFEVHRQTWRKPSKLPVFFGRAPNTRRRRTPINLVHRYGAWSLTCCALDPVMSIHSCVLVGGYKEQLVNPSVRRIRVWPSETTSSNCSQLNTARARQLEDPAFHIMISDSGQISAKHGLFRKVRSQNIGRDFLSFLPGPINLRPLQNVSCIDWILFRMNKGESKLCNKYGHDVTELDALLKDESHDGSRGGNLLGCLEMPGACLFHNIERNSRTFFDQTENWTPPFYRRDCEPTSWMLCPPVACEAGPAGSRRRGGGRRGRVGSSIRGGGIDTGGDTATRGAHRSQHGRENSRDPQLCSVLNFEWNSSPKKEKERNEKKRKKGEAKLPEIQSAVSLDSHSCVAVLCEPIVWPLVSSLELSDKKLQSWEISTCLGLFWKDLSFPQLMLSRSLSPSIIAFDLRVSSSSTTQTFPGVASKKGHVQFLALAQKALLN